jgi:hypothetical protein
MRTVMFYERRKVRFALEHLHLQCPSIVREGESSLEPEIADRNKTLRRLQGFFIPSAMVLFALSSASEPFRINFLLV